MPDVTTIVSNLLSSLRPRRSRPGESDAHPELLALRCATLAGDAGEPPEVIAAALLHNHRRCLAARNPTRRDLESTTAGELPGIHRLAAWFEPDVVEPVRLQGAAGRYLGWKESAYLRHLPERERRLIEVQGGVMTDAEAFEFEVHPHFSTTVRVRRHADLARTTRVATPDPETFRPLLTILVRRALARRPAGRDPAVKGRRTEPGVSPAPAPRPPCRNRSGPQAPRPPIEWAWFAEK